VTTHVVEGRERSGSGVGSGPSGGCKKTNILLFAKNTIQGRKWEEISNTIEYLIITYSPHMRVWVASSRRGVVELLPSADDGYNRSQQRR
jgi:hypothetical protein